MGKGTVKEMYEEFKGSRIAVSAYGLEDFEDGWTEKIKNKYMGKKLKFYKVSHKKGEIESTGLIVAGKKSRVMEIANETWGETDSIKIKKIPRKEGVVESFTNLKQHAN